MKLIQILFLTLLMSSCATTKGKLELTTRPDFTIIAHRGASGYLPEHTLESTALAHGMNPDYIEPDVVLTKDNVPVVLHDIHIDTTTNVKEVFPRRKRRDGRYYAIDFTLKELKKLSVHERTKKGEKVFPKRFPLKKSSFEIPTLEEQIELIEGLNFSRGKNIGIYPEMKNPSFHHVNGKNIADIVWKTLEKYGYTSGKKKIYLQCFDPETLRYIKTTYDPKFPLVQLVADNSWGESQADYEKMMTLEGLKDVNSYADGIGAWIPLLLKQGKGGSVMASEGLRHAKSLNLTVHAYTIRADQLPGFIKNQKELITILSRNGVQGAFTDFPDQVGD